MEHMEMLEKQVERVSKYHDRLHDRIDHYKSHGWFWFWVILVYVVGRTAYEFFIGDIQVATWIDVTVFLAELFAIWRLLSNWLKEVRSKGEHKGLMKAIELLVIEPVGRRVRGFEVHISGKNGEEPKVEVRPIMRGEDTADLNTGTITARTEQTERKVVLDIENLNFKEERVKQGLTQKQLAKKAKVSETILRQIEKDWHTVGLGSVGKVAKALGYDMGVPHFEDVPVHKNSGKPTRAGRGKK